MENWLIASIPVLLKTGLSIIIIYLSLIFITRIAGLRTFSKMSSIDFASTIAIGSILASVILDDNHSVLKGAFALSLIVIFQIVFTNFYHRSKRVKFYLTNAPLLLMKEGVIIKENLKKANISEEDLMASLRESNVHRLEEVKAVILEATGDVSVLHGTDNNHIDEMLLVDVVETN